MAKKKTEKEKIYKLVGQVSLDIFLDHDFTPVCLLFPLRNKVCIINFFY